MSEPSLEEISDYNKVDVEKRRVIIAIILTMLVMGIVYAFAYNKYDNKEDEIQVKEKIKSVVYK